MVNDAYEIVAFDMDGVLVDCQSTWVWIHSHFGVSNELALKDFIEGRIDDLEFMRKDIALWRSLRRDLRLGEVDSILSSVPLMKGVRETVSSLRSRGMRVVIISGGLDLVARRISEEYGFDDWVANGLEHDQEGRLTGEGVLRVRLLNKREALEGFLDKYRVPGSRAVAVGNSFVDVSMFGGAGLSIAYNPIDDQVINNADRVVHSDDLRAILRFIP